MEPTEQKECPICFDVIKEASNNVVTECGHKYHFNCLMRSLQVKAECPLCRKKVATMPTSLRNQPSITRIHDALASINLRLQNISFNNYYALSNDIYSLNVQIASHMGYVVDNDDADSDTTDEDMPGLERDVEPHIIDLTHEDEEPTLS